MKRSLRRAVPLTAALLLMVATVEANEGMWLFTSPPLKQLKGARLRARCQVAGTRAEVVGPLQ